METENDKTNVDDVEETTSENEGKKTSETPKTFTQDELNKVVTSRLAKEKQASKQLSDAWETEKTELTATIESYEGIVKDIVKSKYDLVPAEYQALIDKLPLLEQYEFLVAESKKVVDKKPIPKTPLPHGEDKGESKQERKPQRIF